MDASGHLTIGWIAVFAIVVGLGDGLFYPAFGGMVPLVVDQPMIASANSVIGLARWGSILLGPALAGLLYAPAGSATVFAVDAATFVVSATLVWRTRPRLVEQVEGENEGTLRGIASGARYVRGVPWLWVTIGLFALVLMLQFAPQQVLLPKMVDEQWNRGVGAYALLTTLLGVGTVAGTLLFGHVQPRKRRGVVCYAAFVVNSLLLAAFALSPWYALAGVLAMARGVCIGFGVAVWETMLMELVPGPPALAGGLARLLRLVRADAGRARAVGAGLGRGAAGGADRGRRDDLGRAHSAAADAAMAPRDRLDRAGERVTGGRLAVLVPAREPAAALLRRSVGPGLRVDLALRALLDAVVADRRRRVEPLVDVRLRQLLDQARLDGVRRPDARVAVRLQVGADALALGPCASPRIARPPGRRSCARERP